MSIQSSSLQSRRRVSHPAPRVAGAFPVAQVCEICCLVLCRVIVPKLAHGFDLAS
ncbi:hypothetical protein [Granulicella sp. dw_53]|uniref:hypothetical protein n=1 Tax=Granulicella sp. dw_53 TaxID=2719792 RepID=UPI001BD3E097|nr:hypothetical protein [Granulicella sp. dw_53]